MKPVKTVEKLAKVQPGPKPKHGERARELRVLHMRYPELGVSALARRVGVRRQTAQDVLTRFRAHHSEAELRLFQTGKADVYDAVQLRCLGSVTERKLATASVGTLVTAAAILQDKSQILKGLPTGLDVHVLLDIAAMVRGDRGSLTTVRDNKRLLPASSDTDKLSS